MVIKRIIQPFLEQSLWQGKIIIIYGPRQVGKTTLLFELQKKFPDDSLYLNCDEPDIRASLTDVTSTELKLLFQNKKLVLIDEAQRVKNIGITLKLAADVLTDHQVVATGSSSFDLSNKIVEPLTGRKYEFLLLPFSLEELAQYYSPLEIQRIVEQRIIYGLYPEVTQATADPARLLKEITTSYLFKDAFEYQFIKKPELIEKLLQALALQIGNEVSYTELSRLLGAEKTTIEHYVHLLEQAFIIWRLAPYKRNLRNELSKLRKIYFYDTGVRNALINNLNPLTLRTDAGALWENFLVSERKKFNNNQQNQVNTYFWRTHAGAEIDYLEEAGGALKAYEIKFNHTNPRAPLSFTAAYPASSYTTINRINFLDFCGGKI